MNDLIKNIVITIIAIQAIIFSLYVCVYVVYHKHYNRLMELYREKYEFPFPYSFHCQTGIFGSVAICYFFMMIKTGRKAFFLPRASDAYAFSHDIPSKKMKWLPALFYLSMLSFFCLVLIALLAAYIKLFT
ncbi:hypothetical protein [Serratia rhizosphaerae]|uniref:DUF3899 domain-containing protein n=1 Tax=Serratia rhizosphaerae TaxID=2597702 RepID=A0ABX6GR05_9GAMM|nr:hypothetical protein [Serratia rhizosphaerae]QHA88647.1 hypothetical protein FO014_17640 [Serratia rhizosphaerae]